MLSQKLQDDLMSAYQQVHEGKRGHAAGDSDVEKQASQLASDVKYKAKGKVKEGASEEEKKKVFMQILGASPAPNAVKAMARQKLLGEEVVLEDKKMAKQSDDDLSAAHKKFSGMDQSTPSNKFMVKRIEKEMKKRKTVKEGSAYGMTKGDGMSFPERLKMKAKKKKEKVKMGESKGADAISKKSEKLTKQYKKLSKAERANPAFQPRELNPQPQYNSYNPLDEMSHSTSKKPQEKKITPEVLKKIRATNTGAGSQYEQVMNEFKMTPKKGKSMDPVGQEDGDINNDGKKDGTDKYLASRRKAIGKAIAKKRGKVKEGFSAWRIDLDFNEQVKK